VIHVPNRPHVHMRLGPLELRFRHGSFVSVLTV
jgi:hypothetical protein